MGSILSRALQLIPLLRDKIDIDSAPEEPCQVRVALDPIELLICQIPIARHEGIPQQIAKPKEVFDVPVRVGGLLRTMLLAWGFSSDVSSRRKPHALFENEAPFFPLSRPHLSFRIILC
jgi:hypothetical protein